MNQIQENIIEEQILREIEKLDKSNKKQEQRIRNLESKAVQNVNLYFIFQAVILTSTTTAAAASCRNWWIPFTLSLLAATTNLVSLWAHMSKILESREGLDQKLSELEFIKENRVLPGTRADSVSRWQRRLVAYFSGGLFVGFSAVIMYGCYRIPCQPSATKCVKLC